MYKKMFFILFVLFLLIGCGEKKVTEESKSQEGPEEGGEESDSGIEDLFEEDEGIEPPSIPT